MCGAGTTLIEACLMNRQALGIDIDPIAALISQVSVTPLDSRILNDYEEGLMAHLQRAIAAGDADSIDLPSKSEYPNWDIWFRPDVLQELILIRDTIRQHPANLRYKRFAFLCLSSIVRDVSNADPRDIFPERDQDQLVRPRQDTIAHLKKAFKRNRERILAFSSEVGAEERGQAIQGDASTIPLKDETVDLVFTSPPYAYAMDYARVHKLSTLLFVMTNRQLKQLRRRYIGTDRVSVRDRLGSFNGFEFARPQLESVYRKDQKWGMVLHRYFQGMHQVTRECFRILKPDRRLVYVIGNSTIKRTKFRTDQVLMGICEGVGFEIERTLERPYYAYRMSRRRNIQSNTIKADVFIVAHRPG